MPALLCSLSQISTAHELQALLVPRPSYLFLSMTSWNHPPYKLYIISGRLHGLNSCLRILYQSYLLFQEHTSLFSYRNAWLDKWHPKCLLPYHTPRYSHPSWYFPHQNDNLSSDPYNMLLRHHSHSQTGLHEYKATCRLLCSLMSSNYAECTCSDRWALSYSPVPRLFHPEWNNGTR